MTCPGCDSSSNVTTHEEVVYHPGSWTVVRYAEIVVAECGDCGAQWEVNRGQS